MKRDFKIMKYMTRGPDRLNVTVNCIVIKKRQGDSGGWDGASQGVSALKAGVNIALFPGNLFVDREVNETARVGDLG